MDADRFQRAARDGCLDSLQEANRKELNSRDEDGMTPAMWAAYYGHLDALRLIVGRGGDPDKCDHYGNTSLHCAAGNGHIDCVSFLVNFGVNLWALDNDFHTAKDVSVINQKHDVLRLLDQAQSKHALVNKKLVQRLKEKSVYDAERRVKQYRKMQLKAAKRAEKERTWNKSTPAPKFSDIVNCGERKDVLSERRQRKVLFLPERASSDSSDDGSVLQTLGDEIPDGSIFERPGFGTVFFRHSVVHLRNTVADSIGSASSLERRHITWEEEELSNDESYDVEEPLSLLLAAVGLSEYSPLFQSEQIDLEALSLLSEDDLKILGMPLGPRRKLGRAVQERMKIMQDPGSVQDSPL